MMRHAIPEGARVTVATPDAQTAPEWRGRSGVVVRLDPHERPSPGYVVRIDGRDVFMFEREIARMMGGE